MLLLSLLVQIGTSPAAAEDSEDRYLTISSHGYSRFEIEVAEDSEDDENNKPSNVVAFFTEGVEFTYLGVNGQADSLRYNHATQEATATGNVLLTMDEGELTAQAMVFDGKNGKLALKGGVAGLHQTTGLSFTASEAAAEFAPGEPLAELSQLDLSLSGKVIVTSREGDALQAEEFHYEGATGWFSSIGEFVVTSAAVRWMERNGKNVDLTDLMLTGMRLSGLFSEDDGIQEVVLDDFAVTSRALNFSAKQLTAENMISDKNLGTLVSAEMIIEQPVGSITREDGDTINLAASGGHATIDSEGIKRLDFVGDVNLDYAGLPFSTNSVTLLRADGGFELELSDYLEFDLASIGGYEQISREQLESMLRR